MSRHTERDPDPGYGQPTPAPKAGKGSRAVGDTLGFVAFTAANPTVATLDGASDPALLAQGDQLLMAASTGDPEAVAAVDGMTAEVGAISGLDVSLVNIDLTGKIVEGLVGHATITANAPAPSPSPPPVEPADVATALLTRHPSPGVGTLPVDPQEIEELGRRIGTAPLTKPPAPEPDEAATDKPARK